MVKELGIFQVVTYVFDATKHVKKALSVSRKELYLSKKFLFAFLRQKSQFVDIISVALIYKSLDKNAAKTI